MNFRNTKVISFVILGFLMLSASTFAFDINSTSNIYFTNNYFWRITTVEVNDPHVQFDSNLSTSIGNLKTTLTSWVSYNLGPSVTYPKDLGSKNVDEVNYTLDISYPIINLSINAGAIYYDVTNMPETTEVYGSLGYEAEIGKLLSLSPGVKLYYDVQAIKKAYLEASLSLGTPLFSYVSLKSILGYDFGQFALEDKNGVLVAESKPTTLQLGISADYEITQNITISPSFTYVLGLHEGIDNSKFAAIKFSFEF